MSQIILEGLLNRHQHTPRRNAHMMPVPHPADVQQDILKLRNLGHARTTEKVVGYLVLGETPLAEVKL